MAETVGDAGLHHLQPPQRWFNGLHKDPLLHREVKVRVTPSSAALLHRWRGSACLQDGVPLNTVLTKRGGGDKRCIAPGMGGHPGATEPSAGALQHYP